MVESILGALGMAFAMGWEILWPLILGFALSAVVQAIVSHREMARLLPDDRPRRRRDFLDRVKLICPPWQIKFGHLGCGKLTRRANHF